LDRRLGRPKGGLEALCTEMHSLEEDHFSDKFQEAQYVTFLYKQEATNIQVSSTFILNVEAAWCKANVLAA
jgi:hypothetical protein